MNISQWQQLWIVICILAFLSYFTYTHIVIEFDKKYGIIFNWNYKIGNMCVCVIHVQHLHNQDLQRGADWKMHWKWPWNFNERCQWLLYESVLAYFHSKVVTHRCYKIENIQQKKTKICLLSHIFQNMPYSNCWNPQKGGCTCTPCS